MEAMAGAMTVCIVMMAFVAFVAADTVQTDGDRPDFDWNLVDEVYVSEGSLRVSFSTEPSDLMTEKDYRGFGIRACAPPGSEIKNYEKTYGDGSNDFELERRLISVQYGDAILPVTLEVAVFI